MATFELYRRSTIGMCLTETLDEMVSSGVLSPEHAIQVLVQFDKSMTEALESQVKSKVTIKDVRDEDAVDTRRDLKPRVEESAGRIGKFVRYCEMLYDAKRMAICGLGHLHTYRFCDNVWTFILQNAQFKNEECQETVGRVKIVACDSKLLTQ
ncbi:hypothetical protein RD792_000625 [Penstemon davidsonii]|uniref:Transcription initiation factor IIA subunit 2 n=1 Tax=Penstemon davidsonii TaxID=160366 RepID=A0ABR0DM81_9LAMI|nr:hypothetical protein RD792_000625 [Penstemon davidsonii]